MKRGDIVSYQDRHWLVQTYDPKRLRIAQLLAADGATIEVAHDLDQTDPGFRVLANPSIDWPFLTVPEKPRWGKVTGVSRIQERQLVALVPVTDWVLSDPLRPGGSLFLRPGLGLKLGDILQVRFEKPGYAVNVTVPRTYGTVAGRVAMATQPKVKKGPATSYDRLLADDGDFDE